MPLSSRARHFGAAFLWLSKNASEGASGSAAVQWILGARLAILAMVFEHLQRDRDVVAGAQRGTGQPAGLIESLLGVLVVADGPDQQVRREVRAPLAESRVALGVESCTDNGSHRSSGRASDCTGT